MTETAHRLEGYRFSATTDLDEARDTVARVFCPHRLEIRGRRPMAMVHNRTEFDGFSLNYMSYGAEVDIVPGSLERFYLLQIPLDGTAHVHCGAHSVDSDPGRGTLLSPTGSVDMRWSSDCRKLLVQIDRPSLARVFAALSGRDVVRRPDFDVALDFERPAIASLRRLALLLCEDREAGGLLGQGLARVRMGETLIATLLTCQRHDGLALLERRPPAIAPAHVRRAENFMRENVAEAIGILDVAAAAGVSVRALQEGFRRFRDTTPLESLRAMRLDRVRAELLDGHRNRAVTAVALAWGFTHLGRFAGDYRRRYGETPSETLRRSGAPGAGIA